MLERNRVEDRVTATRPFSGALMRSTVIFTSPDQSRENRAVTVPPSSRREASASDRGQMKYQVVSVISLHKASAPVWTLCPSSRSR